jgi:hypothetical protein
MQIYSTMEQALYKDHSSITVSDSDDGYIGRTCCGSYAELVGIFRHSSQNEHIIGAIEIVNTISPSAERGLPELKQCWPENR